MAAVESTYLDNLRSPVTNTITSDIPTISTHLPIFYSQVSPEDLAETSQDVKAMVYDVTEHLVTIFQAIKDLKLLEEASMNLITAR